MKREILIITAVLLLYLFACNSGTSSDTTISSDTAVIAKGKSSFVMNCSGCHNFRQDGIGPQLGGLTTEVSAGWIRNFIKDPKKIIESGDERSQKVFDKYKVIMPSFAAYGDNQINEIIAFINTHKTKDQKVPKAEAGFLVNPIPEAIKTSGLIARLQLIAQMPTSSDSGKPPLARITKLDVQPGTEDLFILDLRGKLYRLHNGKASVYMDIAKLKPKFINEPGLGTGFGSFVFHPEFAKNGLLYTTHTEQAGSAKADFVYADSIHVALQWVLTEWKTKDPGSLVFSGTGRELLRVNMVSGIHGIQEITFNSTANKNSKDYGLLYMGIGDGGCVENGFPFLAHSKEKVWGTILRIDPLGRNSINGRYGIPGHNPFTNDKNPATLSEIYAYGFRNPYRITWDKQGRMLSCNIGHSNIESINLIKPGCDYGWPIREGTFLINPFGDLTKVYPLPANDSSYHITYPVAQYDHDEGKAICGGFEYRGSAIPQLKGKFLFGDVPTGRLFYINVDDIKPGRQAIIKEWNISIEGVQKKLIELCRSDRVDLHFGQDHHGELYVLTKADGKVYKIAGASVRP